MSSAIVSASATFAEVKSRASDYVPRTPTIVPQAVRLVARFPHLFNFYFLIFNFDQTMTTSQSAQDHSVTNPQSSHNHSTIST